jgi:hypothetical protein
MSSNILGFNSYKELDLVNSIISFIEKTFELNFELEDFYNSSMHPYFKAVYYQNEELVFLNFPIVSSIKEAEVRIKVHDINAGFNSFKDIFNNIIFDYNIEFKKEVFNIHKSSVEDVFEIKSFTLENSK